MTQYYAVVMAGGSGTRFWPMSRTARPKQLLPLLGAGPLVGQTVERLFPLFSAERIFVVTGREHAEAIGSALGMLPEENIIAEPVGRDTAPCIGLAATFLERKDPGSVFCCLPADHHIGDPGRFREALRRGYEKALKGNLVTFGAPPTRPETGYGYIRADGGKVLRFTEKPDEAKAREFLASGDYYWNCGIFVWKTSVILRSISEHLPDHAAGLAEIGKALGTDRLPEVMEREYGKMERISIDYGVMEKVRNAAMIEADFGWDDVGSWTAAAKYRRKDDGGNAVEGSAVTVDTENCIIFSEGDHLVAAFGADDLLVVHTEDATLVCPKERAADLKRLIAKIRERGFEKHL